MVVPCNIPANNYYYKPSEHRTIRFNVARAVDQARPEGMPDGTTFAEWVFMYEEMRGGIKLGVDGVIEQVKVYTREECREVAADAR